MRIAVTVLARVLSAVLALALVAAGVVVVVEVVGAWLDAGWVLLPSDTGDELRSWRWDETPVTTALALLGAVGALAVVVGLWRRPPLTLPSEAAGDVRVERHALEQALRRRIEDVDGVHAAQVRVGRSRVHAAVETSRRLPPDDVRAEVASVIGDALTRFGLPLRAQLRIAYRGGQL